MASRNEDILFNLITSKIFVVIGGLIGLIAATLTTLKHLGVNVGFMGSLIDSSGVSSIISSITILNWQGVIIMSLLILFVVLYFDLRFWHKMHKK